MTCVLLLLDFCLFVCFRHHHNGRWEFRWSAFSHNLLAFLWLIVSFCFPHLFHFLILYWTLHKLSKFSTSMFTRLRYLFTLETSLPGPSGLHTSDGRTANFWSPAVFIGRRPSSSRKFPVRLFWAGPPGSWVFLFFLLPFALLYCILCSSWEGERGMRIVEAVYRSSFFTLKFHRDVPWAGSVLTPVHWKNMWLPDWKLIPSVLGKFLEVCCFFFFFLYCFVCLLSEMFLEHMLGLLDCFSSVFFLLFSISSFGCPFW